MPSSAQVAARTAAIRVKEELRVEILVAPERTVATASLGDMDVHVTALHRLFVLCAHLAKGGLQVVVRTDMPNVLNIRGPGIPGWAEPLSRETLDALPAVLDALQHARAILLRDNGGFAVLYEAG